MHSTAGRLAGKGCISGVCLSSCSSLEEEEEEDTTCTWFVHDGRPLADREGKRMTAAGCN